MFDNAPDALKFLKGGNATITLTSAKSGEHFTFKVQRPTRTTEAGGKVRDHDADVFFVKGLHGSPDVWEDWHFVGTLFENDLTLRQKRGSHPSEKSDSFKALEWTLGWLREGRIPSDLTIQHEGSCCRCGRTLTHPESIESGIGPECAKHFGGAA